MQYILNLNHFTLQMVQECWLGGGLLQAAEAADCAQGELRWWHQELRRLPRDWLAPGAQRHRQGVQDVWWLLRRVDHSAKMRWTLRIIVSGEQQTLMPLFRKHGKRLIFSSVSDHPALCIIWFIWRIPMGQALLFTVVVISLILSRHTLLFSTFGFPSLCILQV